VEIKMVVLESDMSSPRSLLFASSTTLLVGLLTTYCFLPADYASNIFTVSAIGVGVALSIATGVEAMGGIRGLIRVDILMLWVLYGLTFLEFIIPQPDVDALVSADAARNGTGAALLGFASFAVGRHLVQRRGSYSQLSASTDVAPGSMFLVFILAAILGYLHMFLAVDFDLFEVMRQMLLPRFSQSWGRGRFGDASALLVEIGALIYLIPPIAGVIYARSQNYHVVQKVIVTIVLLFTLYYGFASGTRNILATYVITFSGAYFLNKPRLKLWKVLGQAGIIVALLMIGMTYMLEFRQVGLGNFSFAERSPDTLYIDRNMVTISRLTELFPSSYEFLGVELPFNALIHPIPRAIWPGKPEGLSVSIEAAMGADPGTVTFASTFIGEAYISGGLLGVLLGGLLLGAAAEMWNRVGRTNSSFAHLLYASGFFCAALSMRSIQWTTVTMLPTLALWLYGKIWLSQRSHQHRPAARIPKKA
jgi:oligosaccharide repeat unit polymerase